MHPDVPSERPSGRVVSDRKSHQAGPHQVEALEPRLLLSASAIEPIQDIDGFSEYLDSVGLTGLEQMDIGVTLDVPDGFATASASEQVAAATAAGLVGVGTQPVGALTGKIVYVHGGHGYTAKDTGGWGFQRPEIDEINEDLSNQDMMTFLVDILWNAGATIVPLRPVGHQTNEIILDNDDTEVTFVGSWNNSSSTVFYGDAGDTPYRYAYTTAAETAYARYRPTITEAGTYPVYSWTRPGTDRTEQLYKVTHSGGTTEVSVNHRRVGNGLVYLGSYYFEAGTDGYVDISNRNTEVGKVVVADMIRFGNGMGDITPYGTTSGTSRENEPASYWIEQNLGEGIPESEYGSTQSTVSAPPRWAEFMNQAGDGVLSDRVFISYHSNAGGGRGAVGLHNTSSGGDTPNQYLLASILGGRVNDDMSALNGTFEHDWSTRTGDTYQASFNYGEINNSYINDEFDATILEWAFHDSSLDLDLMRDADVRIAVARATYHGLQQYFNSVDGGATGLTYLPDPVTGVTAETNGDGTVTIGWTPPTILSVGGGAPTGYMVYTSLNGYGFDGGTYVAGGAATSHTMTGLDSANGAHYFKVVAVNAGGESLGSQVVAATPLPAAPPANVLIVNGFDRVDRNGNDRESLPNGWTVDRVRLRGQNSGDYAVQVAEALWTFNPALGIDTAQNENIISGDVLLSDYDTVVWISGEESTGDATFNAVEQSLVSSFVTGGGDLLVSGSEIGWDLDSQNNGRTFYNNTLRADYVSDDAGTYNVMGAAGSIFAGMSFSFDNGTLFYDSDFPDVINPTSGASAALSYVGGSGGGAAIQKKGSTDGDVVMLAFPFETITTANDRADVMAAVLNFFGAPPSEIPMAPGGVIATPGDDTVGLDWNDNTESDLLGYNVLRSTVSGGTYTQLNVTTLLLSAFTDNTAVNGTTYFYRVEAIDTDTNVSAPSLDTEATPDDHGNDRLTATSVAMGSTTDGQMAAVDSDWFELTLVGGTDYNLSVLDSGLGNAGIRLYTASGSTLLASNDGPAAGSTLAEIVYSSTFSDTYYIEVVGNGGASGDYQLAVQPVDDHGNSTAEATELSGTFAFGTIGVSGDIDFFHVPVVAGMTYTFKVNGMTVPDAILNLYNAGGALVTQDIGSNPGGTHAQIVWSAPADGFVYLGVAAQPASLGDYVVLISSTTQLVGDLDSDGFVGINDLNIVLGNWNTAVTAGDLLSGDPSGDGFVGIDDLNTVLGNWNAGTPPVAASTSQDETVAASTSEPVATVETTPEATPEVTPEATPEAAPVAALVATPEAVAENNQAQTTTKKTKRVRRAQQQPADSTSRGDRAHGLAMANWRSSARSAFGARADAGYTPAIGLWESEDDA
jgi:hypothetical protein